MRIYNIYIILLFFCCNHLFAQKIPPQLKFWRINELNGLQVEQINDIKQGPLGFIWIATNDGLYRYDGLKFVNYRFALNSEKSLPNNFVSKLFFDSKNRLWVLTDFGVVRYDYDLNEFIPINETQYTENNNLLYNVNGMVEVHHGKFYISTYENGIHCYEENKPLTALVEKDTVFKTTSILTMLIQGDSILWVGTSGDGLLKYNLKKNEIVPGSKTISWINTTAVFCLLEDSEQNIWIGSNQGIHIITPLGEIIDIHKQKGLPDEKILSVYEDREHIMWVGTGESGLLRAPLSKVLKHREHTKFEYYRASENLNTVSYRSINCIFQDNDQNIWLGTYHDGINVFAPGGENVINVMHYPELRNSLPHNRVWGMCEDKEGMLWIGTDGNGITMFDPISWEFNHYPYKNGRNAGPNDKAILTALCDENNDIWFGTYLGGISVFERKTRKFKHYLKDKNGNDIFKSNDIRVIFESANGIIWVGTNRGGLYYFNRNSAEFNRIQKCNYLDIRSITEDNQGVLWLGTYGNGGLASYNPSSDQFIQYNIQQSMKNASPVIYSLCFTSDSLLWLGSQYFGLIRFNIHTKDVKIYSENQGLAHNTVKGIVAQNNHLLWVATEIGVSSFDIGEEKFINFSTEDGFLPGIFSDNSAFISKNGFLAFGGDNGLNLVYPDDLLNTARNYPQPQLTEFRLFNTTIFPGSAVDKNPLNKSILVEDTIVLNYNQDVFSLEFSALIFPFSKGLNYEFMLEGYENEWNRIFDQNNCTYRNLPYGNYKFKVRLAGISTKLHGPERSLYVIVKPPWWRTIYAYTVFGLVLFMAIFIVLRYQLRQLKLRNSLYYEKKLRQQEQELTQEKFKFYTNFSHEMRTPLSLILGPCNDLMNDDLQDEQKHKINLIKRNANYLLELLNKLLEFRKIEMNKVRLNVSHSNLESLMLHEVELFKIQAAQKRILFNAEYMGETTGWADFNSLQVIFTNLMSNAIKFTPVEGSVSVLASNNQGVLNVQVTNSGHGLKETELNEIFNRFFQGENAAGHGGTGIGLSLSKNLIELHKGNISVQSNPMVSTTFTFEIPVTIENYQDLDYVRIIEEKAEILSEEIPANQPIHKTVMLGEQRKLILLVDDNYDLITYLNGILSPTYEIITASDGKSGIHMALEHIPDLIISDVMMPKKSGIELCKELKADIKTSHIPIILLTAKNNNESKIEGYDEGADSYIVKPFDSGVLLSNIQALLRNRRLLINFFKSTDVLKRNSEGETLEERFLFQLESHILKMLEEDVEVSVPELCKVMGYSRSSLYRKVNAISELSVNQIIRSVKLRKVADLIQNDHSLNISEIAYKVGFNDLKYFRECFKEQFGVTPSEFRKN